MRKLWTFLKKQCFFWAVFTHQCLKVCITFQDQYIFVLNYPMYWINSILGRIIYFKKYMNLWTFFNLESWLADDNQLFPCLQVVLMPLPPAVLHGLMPQVYTSYCMIGPGVLHAGELLSPVLLLIFPLQNIRIQDILIILIIGQTS